MVDSTNLPEVDINQIATDLNGKMDRDGVNATASVCIESWHDENGNWYRVYSDGWCEQGGRYAGSLPTQINLFKNYANSNYNVFTQCANKDNINWNGNPITVGFEARTTSYFLAAVYGDYSNVKLNWEAKGYIR